MWLFTSSSISAAEETALARDLGPTTSSVAASKLFFNVQEPTPGSDPTTCSLSSRYRMRSIVDKIYYMGAAEAEVNVQKNIPANIHMPSIYQCEEVNSGEKAFVPSIRSGGFADIGPRRYMEDEHIRIDDLSESILTTFPHQPTAFYGVFDGHGGPEAAAYLRKNAIRFFFEDANLPRACEVINDAFLAEVESCLRKGYLLADMALADETSVSSSSGTTALTALVIGKLLMVANVGDCRAVLSRKGQAIDMSQDHRPNHEPERKRVEEVGGFIDDGYLNGVLSITRALGDWDLKLPPGNSSSSPLIAEPEFRRITLTDDDEFLIIGCDGVWDVMSSQQAVSLVRRGLRRHDDPEQCAKDVVMEALRMNTFDNLTVIVVCFGSLDQIEQSSDVRQKRLRCCSLSPEALCSLRSLLEGRK